MKKINIKMVVVLACMTLGLANVAKAQIYENEPLFFSNTENSYVVMVLRCDGNKLYNHYTNTKAVTNRLRKSPNYYDNLPNNFDKSNSSTKADASECLNNNFIYDDEMSTSSYTVYHKRWYVERNYKHGEYWAISPDLSTAILFSINGNGEAYNKKYYVRVSKEDFLPKAVNPNEYDFLND